jgi:hypothetical protein
LLLKNWHKYKYHFGVYPKYFRGTLKEYFSDEMLNDPIDYEVLKNELIDHSLRRLSTDKLGFEIKERHSEYLKNYIYT